MPYEVRKDLPIPGLSRRWSEERLALDALEVGHALIVANATDLNKVRCACTALKPKRFTVRKLPDSGGWGVWRLE